LRRVDVTGVAVCFGACRNAAQIGRTTVRGIRAGPVEDLTFDTLIVDEAQDFEGDWFDVAGLFLRDGADGLWLEDLRQNLRGIPAPDLQAQGYVGYRSMLNDRSPERISRFIAVALPETPFTLKTAVEAHRRPLAGRETHETGATNRLRRRGERGRSV
jgi:hypothetical protein